MLFAYHKPKRESVVVNQQITLPNGGPHANHANGWPENMVCFSFWLDIFLMTTLDVLVPLADIQRCNRLETDWKPSGHLLHSYSKWPLMFD